MLSKTKEIIPSNVLVGLQTLGLEPEFWARTLNTPTLPLSHLHDRCDSGRVVPNGRVDSKPPSGTTTGEYHIINHSQD